MEKCFRSYLRSGKVRSVSSWLLTHSKSEKCSHSLLNRKGLPLTCWYRSRYGKVRWAFKWRGCSNLASKPLKFHHCLFVWLPSPQLSLTANWYLIFAIDQECSDCTQKHHSNEKAHNIISKTNAMNAWTFLPQKANVFKYCKIYQSDQRLFLNLTLGFLRKVEW